MKPLVCLFLLFFTSEIRSFDIIIEEAPESADLGELLKEFEPSLAERNKRSVLSDDDESEEKSVARNLYSKARARGKAAGLMRTNSMDMENFKAELNVPPGSKVQFEIHYQEALRRKLGVYEHAVFIQPGRLARHLEVDIYITEPQGFSFVNVPKTITEGFAKLVKITQGDKKAHISFKPTLDEQRQCPTCSTTAVNGNLFVKYDVKREESSHLQVFNGYFLHFFAPDNLPTLPKNILFVIDVSGSMWGLKMKQTVDAMKSILEDLNSDDQFGIIDFNHNIRCWKDELVYASSVEKGDASKYVQRIQPNGGTNINDALLRAIFILKEASNKGLLEQNSVSLIVLVSDGDPTVGELKLPKIQKNVRTNIQDDIALHSLGIGFDVDYDFLERLAQENHGMAQRIYGNQDTAAQLKEFYNKVSTPLLKNIVVNYPMESVSDVTQNSFHNYFKGDEIVVAGKLKPESIPNLMSIVSASSVITAAAKRNITQTILQMSIDHHFVTPFTSLLIESENGNERMLADAPRDPKGGCCQTLVVNSRVPLNLPQPTPGPVTEELKRTSTEIYIPNGQKLVDNDPHFIINLPISQINVCFNIDSQPGSILNLVSDPKQGITVNGKIIAAKKAKSGKLNTYFGTIGMYFKKENMKVEISPEKITVKDASYSRTMSWSESSSMNQNGFLVSVKKNSNVTITVNENIRLLVILHQAWKKHPVNVDFLGLYIPNETKLSATTHGLIGQFRNEPEVSVYDVRAGTDPEKPIATMNINGEKFSVTRGTQKEYQTHPGLSTSVTCWFVHNNGKGFIDGHYKDYIVPQIYSFFKRH
ncbi:hypothetical protein XELAEV_18020914mg [Xenopus laevis]|uniref:Inter-alpha-trypsin inhibitor heavy chain H2 n=1 Tax=Xenopus laevis TaxID=8355 RepID=A0A974DAI2_XENLA|nr:hypothetical protein XELAEV_18020914mg [Xenopus laevis]